MSHAYLWFYRFAIDSHLEAGDWAAAELSCQTLADYTRAEPMPWSDFYVARGRALASWGKGARSDALLAEIARLASQAARCRLDRARIALDQVATAA